MEAAFCSWSLYTSQCYTEVADFLAKTVLNRNVEGEGQSFFVCFNEGCGLRLLELENL